MSDTPSTYPLGTADLELERLAFQHELWGATTRAFLERAGLRPGMRVLDLGSGPGFVAREIALRVGPSGRVVALDESPRWIEHLKGVAARERLTNIEAHVGRIEDMPLEPRSFDLIVARWVFSFLSDPLAVAAKLARALAPGGALLVQDYNHEGISLWPDSAGFRAVVRATRALYAGSGGNAFVAQRGAEIARHAGLTLDAIECHVLCGGPGSSVFRWADRFFPHFSHVMEERGLLTADERAGFLCDWAVRKADPAALFFSPIVVDLLARKPLVNAEGAGS